MNEKCNRRRKAHEKLEFLEMIQREFSDMYLEEEENQNTDHVNMIDSHGNTKEACDIIVSIRGIVGFWEH